MVSTLSRAFGIGVTGPGQAGQPPETYPRQSNPTCQVRPFRWYPECDKRRSPLLHFSCPFALWAAGWWAQRRVPKRDESRLGSPTLRTTTFVQQSKRQNTPRARNSLFARAQRVARRWGVARARNSDTIRATPPQGRGTLWSETGPRIYDLRCMIYGSKAKGRDVATPARPALVCLRACQPTSAKTRPTRAEMRRRREGPSPTFGQEEDLPYRQDAKSAEKTGWDTLTLGDLGVFVRDTIPCSTSCETNPICATPTWKGAGWPARKCPAIGDNHAKRSQFPPVRAKIKVRSTPEREVGRGRPTYEEIPDGQELLCETKPISPERQERQVIYGKRLMVNWAPRRLQQNEANSRPDSTDQG